MKMNKGSIAIESLLVMTLFLLIAIFSLGLIFGIYVDQQLEMAAEAVKEDFEVSVLQTLSIVGSEPYAIVLEAGVNQLLSRELSRRHVGHLVNISQTFQSKLTDSGVFYWQIEYAYNFPTIKKHKLWTIPLAAPARGDGLKFESSIVFITNYGEKYHLETCFHLRKSKYPIDIESAIEQGYGACKVCHGNLDKE